ncbi:hypothetical protein NE237_008730 [Protea cynaroides]|uniref:Uncharacterized protein n=1 Tax=Protea cynaroides TaxID=273540 RepID=A0A9Q0QZL4_9MAGN|nr:hypothetical protein NE237_008730 [Protea cynaroides]
MAKMGFSLIKTILFKSPSLRSPIQHRTLAINFAAQQQGKKTPEDKPKSLQQKPNPPPNSPGDPSQHNSSPTTKNQHMVTDTKTTKTGTNLPTGHE